METRKLFYEDSHQSVFDAEVLSCEPSRHGFEVVLNQTCFYPEGGGQPGDTGFLDGIRVTDTHEKEDSVVHYCERALEVGKTVRGEIDYERRFDFMQQHSGEHILSGLIHEKFGYDNVGFHMGSEFVTIDFSGLLTMDDLSLLEEKANRIIWADVPIQIAYPAEEELNCIPYRSKKALTGQVRIVTIPGADICACCGTHVKTTGEIGLIQVFSCVRFHEGVRMEILCGRKALDYLSRTSEQNRLVSGLLSAKPMETAESCKRLLEETAALKYRVQKLEDRIFTLKAEALREKGNVLLFEENLTPDSARRLADIVMQVCGGRACVFSGSDAEGYLYAIGQQDGDLRSFSKALNAAFSGRGGGKPFFVQGRLQGSREGISHFIENWAE